MTVSEPSPLRSTRFSQFMGKLHAYASLQCLQDADRCYTYSDLLDEFRRWTVHLDALKVEPTEVVGLRADFSLHAFAALLALLSRRAVAALLPRNRDLESYLADANAALFLDLHTDGTYECRRRGSVTPGHLLLEKLRDSGDGGIVLFTSGSTSRPKAALQSTERFLRKYHMPGRRFRTLAFLLFDHIAGLDTLFYTLASGGSLILTRHRDPPSILQLIETHRVEVLPASPSFLRLLCGTNDTRQRDLSSLQIITYGSEPMDARTLARLSERLPNLQLSQKYGTTETGSPRCISKGNDSLWVRFNDAAVETKIVQGMLWIRSESTILGYLNAPSPLDEDGWYCTADLVDVDGEWLRFRGRASETINVGGEKVSPPEVEHAILELDFVREVAVRGEAHPLLGQVVTARVVLTDGNTLPPREAVTRIWQHCRKRLASYKAPVKVDVIQNGLVDDRQKIIRNR